MKSTVNERVKQLRITAAMNQTQFAMAIGVSPSLLQKVELGEKDVSAKTLEAIIENLKVPAEWLLEGKGKIAFEKPGSAVEVNPWQDITYKEMRERIERQDTVIDRLTQALLKLNFHPALSPTGTHLSIEP